VIVELVGLVRRAVATSPLPQAQPVAAGVAISGLVDAVHGICHMCKRKRQCAHVILTHRPAWHVGRVREGGISACNIARDGA
jgi:hypothetical protein